MATSCSCSSSALLLLLIAFISSPTVSYVHHIPSKRVYRSSLHSSTTTPPHNGPYNVVLTHCTADFDSLASAVGLAKLWSTVRPSLDVNHDVIQDKHHSSDDKDNPNTLQDQHYTMPEQFNPTYVVLPRGAHPGVAKFLR